jgi:hypothetical protein
MTEQTIVRLGNNLKIPPVGGTWATPGTASATRHSVNSIGYTILAASVSEELQTNSYTIDVPDAGGVQILTLQKSLPSKSDLASLINNAIQEAYPAFVGSLPQYVERAAGWFWVNPTSTDVDVTFSNNNQQILMLGEILTNGQHVLTIGSNSVEGPFQPDSRLGAVSQSLTFHPGQSYRIELPLIGGYGDGVLYRPTNEIVSLSAPATTAEISVSYPSIQSQIAVSYDLPSEIRINSVAYRNN